MAFTQNTASFSSGSYLVRAPFMNRTDLQIPEVEQEADKPSFSCSNSSTTQTPHTYMPRSPPLLAACGHERAFFQSVHQSTAFQNICAHFPIPYFKTGEASDKN